MKIQDESKRDIQDQLNKIEQQVKVVRSLIEHNEACVEIIDHVASIRLELKMISRLIAERHCVQRLHNGRLTEEQLTSITKMIKQLIV